MTSGFRTLDPDRWIAVGDPVPIPERVDGRDGIPNHKGVEGSVSEESSVSPGSPAGGTRPAWPHITLAVPR